MTDIYDIKPLLLWIPINLVYSLIILIILIIAYLLIFRKKENKIVIQEKIEEKVIDIDYKSLITDLEKNIEKYDQETFYHKIDKILRLYLAGKWYKNIKSLTLKELENLQLDTIFIDLLKSIYFKEYANNLEDSISIRKEYIEKLKKMLL